MNKTLHALMTKLQWQLSSLHQQLLTLEQQIATLDKQLNEHQQKMLNACAIPAFILPEREIARLHFMLHQQQLQDGLTTHKNALLSQFATLNSRHTRLNTELRMLEKHQENQLKNQQQKLVLKQQLLIDEWVLQRRGSL